MELIRRYFVQIKSQLMGLTISQKLLIGLLAVVMVATIFVTVIYSAKPQMVPVIPQAMTAEDINKAQATLAQNKRQYQIVGDKILVPADDLYAVRGELMVADALPKNMATAFAAMIRESSPFTTDAMNTRAWNNALQMELTRWIQAFPYVQTGNVIVSMGQQTALGRPAIASTAAVYITTKDGKDISSEQLMCIVEWVSGTVPGLKREDVRVIVNGQRAYHVRGLGYAGAGESAGGEEAKFEDVHGVEAVPDVCIDGGGEDCGECCAGYVVEGYGDDVV